MTSQYHAQQHDMASGAQDWGKGEKIQGHLRIIQCPLRLDENVQIKAPRCRHNGLRQNVATPGWAFSASPKGRGLQSVLTVLSIS
jgi:hypothetical protein